MPPRWCVAQRISSMKKKLTCFNSLLFVALFAATLGACRSDELASRENRTSTVRGGVQRADSFSVELSFGEVPFESRITASQPVVEVNNEGGKEKNRNTRAALVVGNDGGTTINLALDDASHGKLKVLLILRNRDASRIAVAVKDWSLVAGRTDRLQTDGDYTFTWLKGSGPLVKDEGWYVDAMTGGEWDPRTKAYLINPDCTLPNKMYNPGDKLVLGKDIIVPFSLGTNQAGRDGERKWGVRMEVANVNRNPGAPTLRLQCADPEPTFSPYGSLLCMRFRNNTSIIGKTYSDAEDPLFKGRSWQPAYYSYLIRGISVESSSSTTGGWIQVDRLLQPDRKPLQWYGFDGTAEHHAYHFDNQADNPFSKYVKMDGVKDNDYHTGILFKRGTPNKEDAPWTPYYYVWVKSLAEDRSQALYGSLGLTVRLHVYNATLDPATTMNDPTVEPRAALSSRKIHLSGRAYFADASISSELGISPLSLSGPALIYQKEVNGHVMNFWPPDARSDYKSFPNSEFSKRRVNYNAIVRDLKETFEVSPSHPDSPNPLRSNLKWMLPTGPMMKSVFPPQMNNINVMNYHAGGEWREMHEDVSIGGIMLKNTLNYYYNPWEYKLDYSKGDNYYHTYFGLRFVGTPYCTVYRYTLFGKWDARDQGAGSFYHEHSRFVIQARHLGNIPEPPRGWQHFMKTVVAAGVAPADGRPPMNDFWGNDFWNPDVKKGITTRVLAVPGAGRSIKGGANAGTGFLGRNIGTWLSMAVNKNGNIKNPELQTFDIKETSNDGYYYQDYTFNNPFTGSAAFGNKQNFALSVFPFLSPEVQDDPQWLDERR